MGHALPSKLQDMIISKAKSNDPAFGLIAEELEMETIRRQKAKGTNAYLVTVGTQLQGRENSTNS